MRWGIPPPTRTNRTNVRGGGGVAKFVPVCTREARRAATTYHVRQARRTTGAGIDTGEKPERVGRREGRHPLTPPARARPVQLDHFEPARPASPGTGTATLNPARPAPGRPGKCIPRSPGNPAPGILAPPANTARQEPANYHRQGRPPRRDAAGNRPPSSNRRKPAPY